MPKKKSKKEVDLVIKFANQEALSHFASWLCGSGEQQYWQWMECREGELEEEDDIDITVLSFHYHGPENETKAKTDKSRYGEFMCDNTIRTICGRMDKR